MAKVTTTLKVDVGADYVKKWRWLTRNLTTGNNDPVPLAGWTGVCYVKEHPGQSSYTLVASLPVTLGAADGIITLTISAAVNSLWKWTRGYFYLYLTHPTADDVRFAEGWIEVKP